MSKEHLEKYLYCVIEDMMNKVIKSEINDMVVSELDVKLICDIYKFTLVGLVFEWLKNGMKDDPYAVINRMGYLLDGNIKQALKKADIKY